MPKPLLCVTVQAATTAELRAKRDAVVDADLVELRLDSVNDPTCRARWPAGGPSSSSPVIRRGRVARSPAPRRTGGESSPKRSRSGAGYVDVEWKAGFDDVIARTQGRGIVLSMHDFAGVPTDLGDRMRAMRATGAETVKLAVKANRLSDCVPLLDLAANANRDGDVIALAMGPYGLATRALPSRFGSRWTYAGSITEVGQVSAQTLLEDYRFRAVGPTTAIYGLVGGASLTHSLSPAMHNAAFEAAHVDAVCLPFPAVDADDFHTFGRAIGISGASVTIPHKVTLFDRVDELYPVASRIGAINTIRVVDGRWIGGNTDATGFLAPLKDRIALRGLRVAVLGAGGAARAVTVALASSGCSVRLHARNRAQAQQVAIRTPLEIGPWPPEPGSWDLLVNCTPIGMYPGVNDTPLAANLLTGRVRATWSTTRRRRGSCARRRRPAVRRWAGSKCSSRRRRSSFSGGRDAKPPKGVMREAATKGWRSSHAMRITSFEEFKELARRGTFVPVCKEIVADLLTPVSAFLKIAEHADYAFLLESVEGGEHVGRYSFLGKDPFLILRARDGKTTIDRGGQTTESDRPFIETLRRLMADFRSPFVPDLPRFTGGAVGYLGYGAATWFEPVLGDLGGSADGARSRGVHAVRHGPGVRPRPASHPDHRQRPHYRGRRPRVAVPVRVREDSVRRTRARAQLVAGPARAERASGSAVQLHTREIRRAGADRERVHRGRRYLPGRAVAAVSS